MAPEPSTEPTPESTRPRFTVVAAVFDVAAYLPDFIASIEKQDFDLGRVEVVVVDDGSTDDSRSVLEAWAARRPELVRVLTQENAGQGAARNAGLAAAHGEWVTFPDPDDIVDPNYLSALTAVNTFVGMAVDLDHARNRLNRATGGLSGPAIKPLALARCHEAARAVTIPVLGSGGIMSGRDALEFIAVGAAAVQVGTMSFVRPRAAIEVLEEMTAFLAERGVRRIADWRGCLMEGATEDCSTPRTGRA